MAITTFTDTDTVAVPHDWGTYRPSSIVIIPPYGRVYVHEEYTTGLVTFTFSQPYTGTIELFGPTEGVELPDGVVFPPADGGAPDIEAIAIVYLKAHPSIAAICNGRVGSRTPRTTDEPWIVVTQIDDQPEGGSTPLHVITTRLQLDCYGGSNVEFAQAQASLLARTARLAIMAPALNTLTASAVISKVSATAVRRLPDTTLEPARERYILDVSLTARPS